MTITKVYNCPGGKVVKYRISPNYCCCVCSGGGGGVIPVGPSGVANLLFGTTYGFTSYGNITPGIPYLTGLSYPFCIGYNLDGNLTGSSISNLSNEGGFFMSEIGSDGKTKTSIASSFVAKSGTYSNSYLYDFTTNAGATNHYVAGTMVNGTLSFGNQTITASVVDEDYAVIGAVSYDLSNTGTFFSIRYDNYYTSEAISRSPRDDIVIFAGRNNRTVLNPGDCPIISISSESFDKFSTVFFDPIVVGEDLKPNFFTNATNSSEDNKVYLSGSYGTYFEIDVEGDGTTSITADTSTDITLSAFGLANSFVGKMSIVDSVEDISDVSHVPFDWISPFKIADTDSGTSAIRMAIDPATDDLFIASLFAGTITYNDIETFTTTVGYETEVLVMKLDGSDGTPLWSKVISGNGDFISSAPSIVIDFNGDLVLGTTVAPGALLSIGSTDNVMLPDTVDTVNLKLSGSDGSLVKSQYFTTNYNTDNYFANGENEFPGGEFAPKIDVPYLLSIGEGSGQILNTPTYTNNLTIEDDEGTRETIATSSTPTIGFAGIEF